jgi:hypothetical protein
MHAIAGNLERNFNSLICGKFLHLRGKTADYSGAPSRHGARYAAGNGPMTQNGLFTICR